MTFQIPNKRREQIEPIENTYSEPELSEPEENSFQQNYETSPQPEPKPSFRQNAPETAEQEHSAFQQEEQKVQAEEKKDEAYVEPKKKDTLWSELKIENPFEDEQDPVKRHTKRLAEVEKELGTLKQELKREDEENGVFNYRSFKLADKINALNEEKDDLKDDLDLWRED
jgi:hypothetical protein